MRGVFRRTLFPLFLILSCPPTAMLMWYTLDRLDGSISALATLFSTRGVTGVFQDVWGPVLFGSGTAWAIIGIFAAFELVLVRVLPGREHHGPVTQSGHVPVYRANGPLSFAITLALFVGLSDLGLGLFRASIIYRHFGEILGALNLSSLGFCLLLYLKGRFAPSTADSGTSGNPVFDYYWGTELFPRVLGWDVKRFTNCRFAMMGWPLIVISFAAAQNELHGLHPGMAVAVALQLVYVAKFFWWETGYLGSLDIMHDRAGFYIVWGVLVWLPSVYTSHTLYLVDHPSNLGVFGAVVVFTLGTLAIFANYFADAQRQRVRETDGDTKVWGRKPVIVVGHYTTSNGEARENLLLASGFWGIARHFHYVPEILGAVFWTLPVAFTANPVLLPWFYVVFLTVLLTHRALRDDERCRVKYGKDWDAYCKLVPYRILPGVF
ncbi:MAG: 7-dehydrocholesterol reductase [Deltaproteobacteria bacterium]|nr:7-dehydrocholesterol reductase [Deltaproteobacteria bacterium]